MLEESNSPVGKKCASLIDLFTTMPRLEVVRDSSKVGDGGCFAPCREY